MERTDVELRVLGSLIEKELTTPDYYPLTMAALVNACNQKSSRDPVMSLDEPTVRDAMDSLIREGMAREKSVAGSRAARFGHRLGDSLGLRFGFDRRQLSVMAVLMLRGPQTPGELRTRTERMMGENGANIDNILSGLQTHKHGPWVRMLPRESGRRDSCWMHLIGEPAESGDSDYADVTTAPYDAATSGRPDRGESHRMPPRTEAADAQQDDRHSAAAARTPSSELGGTLAEALGRIETLEKRLARLESRLNEAIGEDEDEGEHE
jgi:uncharacterized protein YceH (UPF0502 family)